MTPFRFGPAARQLYGVYHAPTPARAGGAAVLVCAPLGQEGVRFHRLQRVLADRLSGRGVAVLRFDYFGSGESAGDDDEADLASWQGDILLAHDELRRRSRAAHIAWLGARLGATTALRASRRAEPAPERLVLWDPVLDGRSYLGELAAAHARVLAETQHRRVPAAVPPIRGEALGFSVGAEMLSQIAALRLDDASLPSASRITLVGGPGDTVLATLAGRGAREGAAAQLHTLEQGFDWTSEEAMNTALVPAPVLELLAAQLGGDVDA